MQGSIEAQEHKLSALKDESDQKQSTFDELQTNLRNTVEEGKEFDSMLDDRDQLIAELEQQL